jgi:YgiT-type zinc finger domain-containing protein
MNSQFKHCIQCGSKKIKMTEGTFHLKIKKRLIDIPDIQYYTCANCSEQFMNLDNESKVDKYLRQKKLLAA